MHDTRFIFIHGAYGCPEENWFPWLSSEISRKGYDCLLPRFPTPNGQSLQTWLAAFSDQVGPIKSGDIFIAHSLGPAFVLNLLSGHVSQIRAAFFVAPFVGNLGNPDFDTINDSLVNAHFDWTHLSSVLANTFIFSSENDPYVPLSKGTELAALLNAKMTVVPDAGHFNARAGYNTFPQLLTAVESLLASNGY